MADPIPADFIFPEKSDGSALGWYYSHDPTLVKLQNGSDWQYIVYGSNFGVTGTASNDRGNWTLIDSAFWSGDADGLEWLVPYYLNGSSFDRFEGDKHYIRNPDVTYVDGQYVMYYSAGLYLSQRSVIGVATSETGEPGTWKDHGKVVSAEYDHWYDFANNRIVVDPTIAVYDDGKFEGLQVPYRASHPNLFVDPDTKRWYLTFGSNWDGIYQMEINPETGKLKDPNSFPTQLASRLDKKSGYYWYNAFQLIEGPALFKHGMFISSG